jgi:hypothetical protein
MTDSTSPYEGSALKSDPLERDEHEESYAEFSKMMNTVPHIHELENWVFNSEVRKGLFADLAIGQIIWPKYLGLPDSPTLSGGFAFDTQFWVDIWHIGLDGNIVVDKNGWVRGDDPVAWDASGDADHYAVRYLFHAANENDNLMEVRFSGVSWQHPGVRKHRHHQRYLSVPGWQFYSAGQFTALPDITIGTRPFFHR